MLEVKIEGVYESDIGSGQKKYVPFEYTYKTARVNKKGLFTHALRRHAPYLIQKDKKNAKALFSRIKTMVISDVKELDEKCYLEGKDVKELNDWEIQDLACLYNLYEIPLHGVFSLPELREKAVLAYMEKVLNIPMKKDEQKAELEFFAQQDDGTYALVMSKVECPIQVYNSILEQTQSTPKKKTIADFIQQAGKTVANGILNATGNQVNDNPDEQGSDENNAGMPSVADLIK